MVPAFYPSKLRSATTEPIADDGVPTGAIAAPLGNRIHGVVMPKVRRPVARFPFGARCFVPSEDGYSGPLPDGDGESFIPSDADLYLCFNLGWLDGGLIRQPKPSGNKTHAWRKTCLRMARADYTPGDGWSITWARLLGSGHEEVLDEYHVEWDGDDIESFLSQAGFPFRPDRELFVSVRCDNYRLWTRAKVDGKRQMIGSEEDSRTRARLCVSTVRLYWDLDEEQALDPAPGSCLAIPYFTTEYTNPFAGGATVRFMGHVDDELLFNGTIYNPNSHPALGCNMDHDVVFSARLRGHESFTIGIGDNHGFSVGVSGRLTITPE